MFKVQFGSSSLTIGTRQFIPEQRLDPPEISEAEYEKNIRHSILGDCLDALDTLESRLDELKIHYSMNDLRLMLQAEKSELED